MRKTTRNRDILQNGGLWLHKVVGRLFGVGFPAQCLVVTSGWTVMLLLASAIDHSLSLPGRDVGFLEHPAIWGFLILQTAIPISLARTVNKLKHSTLENGEVSIQKEKESDLIIPSVEEFLHLKSRGSQLAATLIYCVGLVAWGLNTYQNQFPRVIVPYDFWDSTTFVWGYALTRIYKFYLFVVLLPYLAMIQTGVLFAILRLIRRSRISGKLKLLPFHSDGLGGFGFIAGVVSKPITLTLLIGALTTTGAFIIHRAANITPVVGLLILLAWAFLTYVIPILFLRTDIVALKRDMIKKLRSVQQANYSKLFETDSSEYRVIRKEKDALEYFDLVCARVESISNYPHWKRLTAFVGLAVTPSVFSLLFNAFGLFPALSRVLRRP
jgi:hypothetical protein